MKPRTTSPAAGRLAARTLGLPTLLLLATGALSGCTIHTHGSAKSGDDASCGCSTDAHHHGDHDQGGSAHGSASASGSARASGKADGGGRLVFRSKPRVSFVSRADTSPAFVGLRGDGRVKADGKGSASIKVRDRADGSAKDLPDRETPRQDKPTTKGGSKDRSKDLPRRDRPKRGEVIDVRRPTKKPPEGKTPAPAKDGPTHGKGEEQASSDKDRDRPRQGKDRDRPRQGKDKDRPTHGKDRPSPERPIDPPSTPPDNVFGYEEPVRGCFEGHVFFIPENSRALPQRYDDLTSSAVLYACEWDIPTRAWQQGFPGLEDRFEWFAIRYSGAFRVSQGGSWSFRLASDDGSRLVIDDKVVIDNDGVHSPKELSGTIELSPGDHRMVLEYFQGPRYHINLQLYATPPGGSEGIFSVR